MTGASRARVGILADDLIWGVRLAEQATAAGAEPVAVRDAAGLEALLAGDPPPAGLVIDLTARAYDGVAACHRGARAGVPVLAIGQHDDHVLRQAALAAGAERVLAYRKMATDGATVLGLFLATDRTPLGPRPVDGILDGAEGVG